MRNVIAYFTIITKPKVTIFDCKSTSSQFYGQWRSPWANPMNNIEMRYSRIQVFILEPPHLFLKYQ